MANVTFVCRGLRYLILFVKNDPRRSIVDGQLSVELNEQGVESSASMTMLPSGGYFVVSDESGICFFPGIITASSAFI